MFKSLVCATVCAWLPSLAVMGAPSAAAPTTGDFVIERVGDVNDADARAVREVVQAQLNALAADDATQAFAQASTAIQRQFQDAAGFARMVRGAYPMLIRPASTSFYRPSADGPIVNQPVMFRDAEGRYWRADYQLQRQADRRWRIEGCRVAPADAASTT